MKEQITHESLKNPVNAGESLRALTYPDQAYKVVKAPKAWLMNKEFTQFMKYFLPRFTFDFIDEEGKEDWQICNTESCELLGTGLKEFMDTLTKSAPEQ